MSLRSICVVGSAIYDLTSRVPRLPLPGETVTAASYTRGFGGKGANQAVMAARMGERVSLIAKLGRDSIGDETVRHLMDEGIDSRFVTFDPNEPSGIASIWVDEKTGQNSIVLAPGASSRLSRADVRTAAEAITSSRAVVCQMETPLECALEAFTIARNAESVMTFLNPAPYDGVTDELLKLTDVLIPNESEASGMTGLPVTNFEQAEIAARALQSRAARTVIITLGAQGALALTDRSEVIVARAPQVDAVDTTGAGDCFIGSLAHFLSLGFKEIQPWLDRACMIASMSVRRAGAQSSFPTEEEMRSLF